MAHVIDLDAPPPVGTLLIAAKIGMLTLTEVRPHTRRDGQPTVVLVWSHSDGRQWTSGLRAKGLSRVRG